MFKALLEKLATRIAQDFAKIELGLIPASHRPIEQQNTDRMILSAERELELGR